MDPEKSQFNPRNSRSVHGTGNPTNSSDTEMRWLDPNKRPYTQTRFLKEDEEDLKLDCVAFQGSYADFLEYAEFFKYYPKIIPGKFCGDKAGKDGFVISEMNIEINKKKTEIYLIEKEKKNYKERQDQTLKVIGLEKLKDDQADYICKLLDRNAELEKNEIINLEKAKESVRNKKYP